jgi:hypothetical protein
MPHIQSLHRLSDAIHECFLNTFSDVDLLELEYKNCAHVFNWFGLNIEIRDDDCVLDSYQLGICQPLDASEQHGGQVEQGEVTEAINNSVYLRHQHLLGGKVIMDNGALRVELFYPMSGQEANLWAIGAFQSSLQAPR